ncbi:hypothetical protein HK096_009291, partial [Nowakowskiella sp. JEL0078]
VPGLLVRIWNADNEDGTIPCIVVVSGFVFGVPSLSYFISVRSFRLHYFLTSNRQLYLDSEQRDSESQFSYRSNINLETNPERKVNRNGFLKNAAENDSNIILIVWFIILALCSIYTLVVGYLNSKVNLDLTQVECPFRFSFF